MIAYIISAVIAYLIGSISSSVIISKKLAGFDVREKGSGNAGTTNVLRTVGKKAALITLVCDVLKGVVAIGIALIVGLIFTEVSKASLVQVAGLFVVIGHTFPVFFKFKGGKGVATSLGVLLMTNWKVGLICLVFAIALMALTKMVSLGSISAAVLFAVLALFMDKGYIVEGNYVIFAICLAALVIFNHRSNLKRISEGTENKLDFEKMFKSEPKEEKKVEEVVKEEPKEEEKSEETTEEKEESKEDNKEENEESEEVETSQENNEEETSGEETAENNEDNGEESVEENNEEVTDSEESTEESEEEEKAEEESEENDNNGEETADSEETYEENVDENETEEVNEEAVEENDEENNTETSEEEEDKIQSESERIDDVVVKAVGSDKIIEEKPIEEFTTENYEDEDNGGFFDGKKRPWRIKRRFTTKEDRRDIERMVREAEERRKKQKGED